MVAACHSSLIPRRACFACSLARLDHRLHPRQLALGLLGAVVQRGKGTPQSQPCSHRASVIVPIQVFKEVDCKLNGRTASPYLVRSFPLLYCPCNFDFTQGVPLDLGRFDFQPTVGDDQKCLPRIVEIVECVVAIPSRQLSRIL